MAVRDDHVIPLDTSVASHARQVEAWIAMGPEGRVRLAASMSDDVRRVAAQGLAVRRRRFDTPARPSR